MKLLGVCALAIILCSACVRRPRLSGPEQCATREMVLEGVTTSYGAATGVATRGGSTAIATGYSYGESVSCRRPGNAEEMCELRAATASAQVKYGFSPGWRNLLIGVGWFAFVVPGVVLYFVFDAQSDGAAERADVAFNEVHSECMATYGRTKPADDNETTSTKTVNPFASNERALVTDSRPIYCTLSMKNRDVGACSLVQAECTELRHAIGGADDEFTDCEAAPGAACFNANNVIDGARRTLCFPSVTYCEARLVEARKNPDLTVTAAQCGVYRVQK